MSLGRVEVDCGSVDQQWPTRARSDGPGVNLNKPTALSLAPRLRCALYSRLVSHLERFTRAQDQPHSGFAAAFAELRAGRKTGHWIWYVFPQLAGLGTSEASQLYGIRDGAEAIAYLRDPVPRGRLLSAATAVLERPARRRAARTPHGRID